MNVFTKSFLRMNNSNSMAKDIPAKAALVIALLAITSFSGCTSLMGARQVGPLDNIDVDSLKKAGYAVGPSGTEIPVPTKDDGRPSVVLEVHDGKKHLERIPMPAEKPMFIADVVRDAKLVEKVGRLEVVILRPTAPNNPPVRMVVDFDTKGKTVMEGQNYSLRSGDHVIVRKDPNSAIDRIVQSVAPWTKK